MNTTILNFNPLNVTTTYGMNVNLPLECWKEKEYSIECLYKLICPQINNHFVRLGIIIIITYIIISWIKWWFFNHGYKKFNLPYFDFIHHRLYWNMWIQDRFIIIMVIYIAMVVYLSW